MAVLAGFLRFSYIIYHMVGCCGEKIFCESSDISSQKLYIVVIFEYHIHDNIHARYVHGYKNMCYVSLNFTSASILYSHVYKVISH